MSEAEIQKREAVAYQQGKKEANGENARLCRQLATARELLKLAMACEPEDKEMWEPDAKAFLDGEDKADG